jgi:hypothetical protein
MNLSSIFSAKREETRMVSFQKYTTANLVRSELACDFFGLVSTLDGLQCVPYTHAWKKQEQNGEEHFRPSSFPHATLAIQTRKHGETLEKKVEMLTLALVEKKEFENGEE